MKFPDLRKYFFANLISVFGYAIWFPIYKITTFPLPTLENYGEGDIWVYPPGHDAYVLYAMIITVLIILFIIFLLFEILMKLLMKKPIRIPKFLKIAYSIAFYIGLIVSFIFLYTLKYP